jgi:hypothetical protein
MKTFVDCCEGWQTDVFVIFSLEETQIMEASPKCKKQ